MAVPVIIAETQRFISCCIARNLEANGFEMLATVEEAEALGELTVAKPPELCLMGFLGGETVLRKAVATMRNRFPECKIVLIDVESSGSHIETAEMLEVDGYLTLELTPDMIVSGIGLILAGTHCFTNQPSQSETSSSGLKLSDVRFTPREHEVLGMIIRGQVNKMIARNLNISESTVKTHLNSILEKTGTTNRTHAACWALQRGYCDPDDFPTFESC